MYVTKSERERETDRERQNETQRDTKMEIDKKRDEGGLINRETKRETK